MDLETQIVPDQQQTAEPITPAVEVKDQTTEVKETPKPAAEPDKPIVVEDKKVVPPTAPKVESVPDWKTSLKSAPKGEVINELFTDEKHRKLANLLAAGADLKPYFQAYNTDFNAVPAVDLLRMQVAEEFSDMSVEEREEYVQNLLEKKYAQNEHADDRDKKFGLRELQKDLKGYRENKIKEQTDMKIDPADPAAEYKQRDEMTATFTEKYKVDAVADPLTVKIMADKLIPFEINMGEGKAPVKFNYGVEDPRATLGYVMDPNMMGEKMFGENMKPDMGTQWAIAAMLQNKDAFIKSIFDQGVAYQNVADIKEKQQINQVKQPGGAAGGKMDIYQAAAAGLTKEYKQN